MFFDFAQCAAAICSGRRADRLVADITDSRQLCDVAQRRAELAGTAAHCADERSDVRTTLGIYEVLRLKGAKFG